MMPRILTIVVCALLCTVPSPATARSLSDFSSDGCSLFPDGGPSDPAEWCDCCFRHDIAYWQGGTAADRLRADEALRACVRERTGSSSLAGMMYEGVRFGGHPVFPNWYRWGYGWSYGRGYAPLTDTERREAEEQLGSYFRKHPGGYCPSPAR